MLRNLSYFLLLYILALSMPTFTLCIGTFTLGLLAWVFREIRKEM